LKSILKNLKEGLKENENRHDILRMTEYEIVRAKSPFKEDASMVWDIDKKYNGR